MHSSRLITLLVAAALALGTGSGRAVATEPESIQTQIDAQLRDYPGGLQVSPNMIEYHDGSVRVVFGAATAANQDRDRSVAPGAAFTTTYVHGCPKSFSVQWFCFYENAYWNESIAGRILEFKDSGLQSLANYGFANMTSSWVNTTGSSVAVFDSTGGSSLLWTEGANSVSSYVGATNNDRASSFRH
jgi:hypothetical protein